MNNEYKKDLIKIINNWKDRIKAMNVYKGKTSPILYAKKYSMLSMRTINFNYYVKELIKEIKDLVNCLTEKELKERIETFNED